MFNHQSALEILSSTLNGLKIHSLNFVEHDILDLHPNEIIATVGLSSDCLIECEVSGQSYGLHNGGAANANIKGFTILVKSSGFIEPIVFIQIQPPRESDQSDELFEHWKYLTKLCALVHWLGHVEDIHRKSNSNFIISQKVTMNLLRAEIYAHTYCLKYLTAIGAVTARSTMAKSIYYAAIKGCKFQK